MRRRAFLQCGSASLLSVLPGCLSENAAEETGSEDSESEFDDPSPPWSTPDSVYYQGHRKGMKMIGTAQRDNRTIALTYTYAERFWSVTGEKTQRVAVEDGYNAIHLMASVWHTETNTVLPVDSGLRVSVEQNGETVTERALWPMLSQRMGFHFGDNIEFPSQEEYSLVVDIGNTTIERFGPLSNTFQESGTVSFPLDFRRTKRNEIPISDVLNRRGENDALSPMEMEMLPLSVAPSTAELPGRVIGEESSGDAEFVVTTTDVSDGTRVVVSPRTPYNQYVLPMMALSVTVERDGTRQEEATLSAAIGPQRTYHYRTVLEQVESGDELTLSIDTPPQVARHSGYETAFLDMPDVTVTV